MAGSNWGDVTILDSKGTNTYSIDLQLATNCPLIGYINSFIGLHSDIYNVSDTTKSKALANYNQK